MTAWKFGSTVIRLGLAPAAALIQHFVRIKCQNVQAVRQLRRYIWSVALMAGKTKGRD
jgi:hypothetical protein